MRKDKKKPKWGKPKLIVLVRGKSEEGLMMVCKNAANFGSGPQGFFSKHCIKMINTAPPECALCDSYTLS